MGIFRTLLAFLVVCAHLPVIDEKAAINWLTGGADMAVNAFFLLSGFYMTLVLDRKYKNKISSFLLSRALRLYPLYWTVAGLTLLSCWLVQSNNSIIMPHGFPRFYPFLLESISHAGLAIIIFIQNLTFLGLDFNKFLCANVDGSISLHGQCSLAPLGGITLVPQAWSLGTEALFYLTIPFILRGGSKVIFATTLFALIFNALAPGMGIEYPHNRDLFFIPLIYFMLGVISFKAYARWGHYLPGKKAYWPLVVIFIALALGYTYNFDYGYYPRDNRFWYGINSGYYLILALLVPALFHASKQSTIDNFLGEFSYPIYITHNTIGFTVALTLPHLLGFDIKYDFLKFAYYLLCILLVAVAGFLLVVRPIEILRGRRTAEERRVVPAEIVSANVQ